MKYKKEDLEEFLINQKMSFEAVGRHYGISGTYVIKLANKMGIYTRRKNFPVGFEPHNKGKGRKGNCLNCNEVIPIWGKKYCKHECATEHRSRESYRDFLENNDKYCRANYTPAGFKPKFLQEQDYKCAVCSMPNEWNEKPLVFVLDHIDGDAANNKRDNLRLVCHNCDSQLDTYKSKNKNSSRHYARYGKEKKIKE